VDAWIEVLKYLFGVLNGITETLILFILLCYDTSLGGKWRKHQGVAKTSGGALSGWREKMPLVFMPFLTWMAGVAVFYLPSDIAGRTYTYDPFIFDLIAFVMFWFIAKWTIKSILANMQLAGMEMPDWAIQWVEDEFKVKLSGSSLEPVSASKEQQEEQ
jgi:hypothetical protein